MPDKNHTHLAFLLDRSGSMWSIKQDVEGGFDAFIETQKETEGACHVTLAQFNTAYTVVYAAKPVSEVPALNLVPSGGTALYDSMAALIEATARYLDTFTKKKRPASVIVAIMTDGYGNSSREWNSVGIKKLVEAKTEEGWQFLYMGADQDAIEEAGKVGIAAGNSISYTRGNAKEAILATSSNVAAYRSAVAMDSPLASVAYSADQREVLLKD